MGPIVNRDQWFHARSRPPSLVILAMRVMMVAFAACLSSPAVAQEVSPPALKAAFILNFVKFSEFQSTASGPIAICVVSDRAVGDALASTAAGQTVNGRPLEVKSGPAVPPISECNVLYLGDRQTPPTPQVAALANGNRLLTVSDRPAFASTGGVIELFVQDGKMRFAINVDSAKRAGVQLSARLLALAKIVRDSDVR